MHYELATSCYVLWVDKYVLCVNSTYQNKPYKNEKQIMVQVISVVQEKGGAGKTTLLTAIASLMVADGAKVAVIDTDPQRHLEAWAKKEKTPLDWTYVEDDEMLLPTVKALKKETEEYDVIFVDTAGFKSAMAMHAIAVANLILIPSKANEADARGAKRTFSHVKSISDTIEKSLASYVIMMDIDTNTNITSAITEALDSQGVPRLKAMCGHRTGFKEMTSTGKAPEGSAKRSIQSVLAELQANGLLEYYRSVKWQS